MTRRGFYIDEDVYWKDPKTCEQRAIVLDVAGHWVFLRIESGPQKGQHVWVHYLTVKHLDFNLESPHILHQQNRRSQACHYLHLANPDTVGVCEVCFGELTPLQHEHDGQSQTVAAWRYCSSCNRTQRHEVLT
ncbi:MAG: hypothetical protein LC623_08525 [Halobacteriales archaeon]|nr:hypothetical protein [Halobacteriales archaeon]